MKKILLQGTWTLSNENTGNFLATVPGCVHTDLKNNGVIPDYFWRDDNLRCQWIEREDWTYSCRFDFPQATETARKRILFEGIDTYADVYLNGHFLGEAHNMFIPHRFPLQNYLREKDNLLQVKFRSPIREVENKKPLTGSFTCERLHTRRMQCTYSWDWVDRFVTCGIFRPVYIETENGLCVENTYIYTSSIDDFGAEIHILTDFENYERGGQVCVEIFNPDKICVYQSKRFVREQKVFLCANVKNPRLWWPNGYGEHPLYTLRITASENVHEEKFGIRTVRLVETPDEKDGEYAQLSEKLKRQQSSILNENDRDYTEESAGFFVVVNGVRVYCRGANWVPCEPFPSEESEEKIRTLIDLAVECNMNMLRVWGGGLFEKDYFYTACDENGLFVTQDFLMACGNYPQDDPAFLEELKRESKFATKRLRNHPCLLWWAGDNENGMRGDDLLESYIGREAALLGAEPQILEFDFMRRFLRSSPYGGSPYMSVTRGTTHTTNFVWYYFEYFLKENGGNYKEFLENFLARFIVEDPVCGMPQRSSLLRFLNERDLKDENETILRYHCRSNPALSVTIYDYLKAFTEKIFGAFKNDDDRFFKYEYLGYEWLRVVFENNKRNIGYNDGLLFWMLNDCWPASMGWAIVDYYNLPKAAFYAFKRCTKPVIGSIKKENGKFVFYLSSDGANGRAKITVKNKDGEILQAFSLSMQGYGATKFPLSLPENTPFVVCDVEYDGASDRCFYKDGALILKETGGVKIVAQTENTVTVFSKNYAHAIRLSGDFVFSDNYFSMLAGERKTISFRKANTPTHDGNLSLTAYTL